MSSNHFGVLTGMGAGQIPMYYGYNLPGPDPYDYLRGDGCEEIQNNLGLLGDYRSRHPESMNHPIDSRNNPNNHYGGYGSAGYGGYSTEPTVMDFAGDQFDPWSGAYHNPYSRR